MSTMVLLTKQFIDSLKFSEKDGDKTYFDEKIAGFGVRVRTSSMSYIVMYRNQFGQKRKLTIAKTNQISATEARKKAEQILADIRLNNADPTQTKNKLKNDLSVSELCEISLQI